LKNLLYPVLIQSAGWRTIFILALTGMFDFYYLGLLSFSLPQLQDQFNIPEAEIAPLLGLLRLSVIPALFIILLADLVGRKKLIIASNIGLIVLCLLTANAGSIQQFILFQFITFMFISAELGVATIMIVEDAKKKKRSFSVSLLAGFSSVGTASAAIVYAWNSQLGGKPLQGYYYGILPLLIVLVLRSRLQETPAFAKSHSRKRTLVIKTRRIIRSVKRNVGLISNLGLISFLFDSTITLSYILASKYLQEAHHFSSAAVSALVVGAGFFATVASTLICYISDIRGRKPVMIIAMFASFLSILLFYHAADAILYVGWFFFIAASAASNSLLATSSAELFPSSSRATITGIRGIFAALGTATALMLEGWLVKTTGAHDQSISIISLAILLAIGLVISKIPETANKPLPG
jgi:MFS family permease